MDLVGAVLRAGGDPERVGISLCRTGEWFGHRSEAVFYPASVCKLFWYRWAVELGYQCAPPPGPEANPQGGAPAASRPPTLPPPVGGTPDSPSRAEPRLAGAREWPWAGRRGFADLDRALKAMIQESDNDATSYVIDVLSQTTSGPELEGEELEEYLRRRSQIDAYAASQFGGPLRLANKTFEFGPYGRESQLRAVGSNLCTPAQAVRCLQSFFATADGGELLQRVTGEGNGQADRFIGAALPAGTRLWSKAGWTSRVRHDVARLELDGAGLDLAIFTEGASDDEGLIGRIAGQILKESR